MPIEENNEMNNANNNQFNNQLNNSAQNNIHIIRINLHREVENNKITLI